MYHFLAEPQLSPAPHSAWKIVAVDWNIYSVGVLSRVTVSHNLGLEGRGKRGTGNNADAMKQVL